jgi:hypothetical protein
MSRPIAGGSPLHPVLQARHGRRRRLADGSDGLRFSEQTTIIMVDGSIDGGGRVCSGFWHG